MFRFLRIAAGVAIVTGLVTLPLLLSGTEAASTNVSVIVELRDDPGAVYAAKLRNPGAAVSNDQVQTYEQALKGTSPSVNSTAALDVSHALFQFPGERQRLLASKRSRVIVGIGSGHVFGTAVGAPLPCQITPSCRGYRSAQYEGD